MRAETRVRIKLWGHDVKCPAMEFLGGPGVENPPDNNVGDVGSIPGPGRSCLP